MRASGCLSTTPSSSSDQLDLSRFIRDDDTVGIANWLTLERDYPELYTYTSAEHFGGWSWSVIPLVDYDDTPVKMPRRVLEQLVEILDGLSCYPSLDDSLHSEVEQYVIYNALTGQQLEDDNPITAYTGGYEYLTSDTLRDIEASVSEAAPDTDLIRDTVQQILLHLWRSGDYDVQFEVESELGVYMSTHDGRTIRDIVISILTDHEKLTGILG